MIAAGLFAFSGAFLNADGPRVSSFDGDVRALGSHDDALLQRAPMTQEPRPSEARPLDARLVRPDLLLVQWSDGRKLVYPTPFLRAQCPCAVCVDEWTGEIKVNEAMFAGVTLKALRQVGQYAFSIVFSDGHGTGIFTYERLMRIGRPADQPQAPGT